MEIEIIDGQIRPGGILINGIYVFDDDGLVRCEIRMGQTEKVTWDREKGGKQPKISDDIMKRLERIKLKAFDIDHTANKVSNIIAAS